MHLPWYNDNILTRKICTCNLDTHSALSCFHQFRSRLGVTTRYELYSRDTSSGTELSRQFPRPYQGIILYRTWKGAPIFVSEKRHCVMSDLLVFLWFCTEFGATRLFHVSSWSTSNIEINLSMCVTASVTLKNACINPTKFKNVSFNQCANDN